MSRSDEFLGAVRSEFPGDRVTFQKGVPAFHPETAEEAAGLFKLANQHQQKVFISGFGNNISPTGPAFDEIITIQSDRLNTLLEVAAQNYYITVGGGYPLREINRQLAPLKLALPHSNLPCVSSVGGAIAVGLSADLHGRDLPLKKYFIKAEIVTPEGDIIKPGSTCFKSVSGYDIIRIFSGSWGVLGMIVSATFRVMPESGLTELSSMRMKAVSREDFLNGLAQTNTSVDAVYSRKVKDKFDPNGVLPIV
ncbi:MAG: FAD-binding oxidoreductase [bacterium]